MEALSWDAWVKGEVIGGKEFRERDRNSER